MSDGANIRRAIIGFGAGTSLSLVPLNLERPTTIAGPDDTWVNSIFKVLDPASAVSAVIAIEVDNSTDPGTVGRALAQDLDALRRARSTHVFAFLANAVDLGDDRFDQLTALDGFDVALSNATPVIMKANIKGLLRLIAAPSVRGATPATVAANARLVIGGWTIDLARKRASRVDGQTAVLSELEINFIRRLAAKEGPAERANLMIGEIRETTTKPGAVVHKIRKKLGKDFPIVSLGGEDYRIMLDA